MSKFLEQKIALVTGASRGIGAAIARRLANDGAELVLHYGHGRAEIEALAASLRDAGSKVHLLQADLSETDGAQRFLERLTALALPRIDILVNNAGVAPAGKLNETTVGDFDNLLNVNVRSMFLITQGVAPMMPAGARIVNVSTGLTRTVLPGVAAYSASKGFVDVLTLHLAAELGARNITVNAVAPGIIDTRMNPWIHGPGGKDALAQLQALPGIGQPEYVAGVVAFLVGPDGIWTTGQVIDVSGGSKL